MHDARRWRVDRQHVLEQALYVVGVLRIDGDVARIDFAPGLAGQRDDDFIAGIAQALREAIRQARTVGQDQRAPRRRAAVRNDSRRSHAALPHRLVEPLRQILALVQRPVFGRQHTRHAGLDPMALVIETVGRQLDAVARLALTQKAPIDIGADGPQAAEGAEHEGLVVHRFVRVAHRGDDRLRHLARRVTARQARQRAAGADLEQHARLIGEQLLHAVGKTHRVPQVAHPIVGRGRFGRSDRLAGEVGNQRNRRRVHRDAAQEGAKLGQDRLQHRRMRGDVDAHARGVDLHLRQTRLQRFDRCHRARSDAQARAVDDADRQIR